MNGVLHPPLTILMLMRSFVADCRDRNITLTDTGFEEYLHDESHFRGFASGLIRARTEAEVVDIVRLANRWEVPLTVVSGKTSITGGPVPLGGVVLDVKGLDFVDPDDVSRAGPGVILKHYKESVETKGLFYPPDPTSEESCTLGGNVACNASGALSYLYGPTREYIRGLKIVLPAGAVLNIERGDVLSRAGIFEIPRRFFSSEASSDLLIPVPRTGTRPWTECKNAAGLFSSEPMDLVDLFIGSEGILGVVLEVKTMLLPARNPYFGMMLYLPDLETTAQLVGLLDGFKSLFHDGNRDLPADTEEALRMLTRRTGSPDLEAFKLVVPSCLEWFHRSVARFLAPERAHKLEGSYGALYVEQEYSVASGPVEAASQWASLVEGFSRSLAGQSSVIRSEVALDPKQVRALRIERKAVPEKLNESIRPGMVKIGTDFAVPQRNLRRLLELYETMLPHGKSYIFGHIGNAHLHANMLPENELEAAEFRRIYHNLAGEVCRLDGSVSAEHGIGKLKREALEMMLGPEGIDEIRKVKNALDPKGILNVPNMVTLGGRKE